MRGEPSWIVLTLLLGVLGIAGCTGKSSNEGQGSAGKASGGSSGSGATGGGATGGTAGGGAGSGGAGGSAGASLRRGDVIPFVPGSGEVPYALGENPYGLRGGGFLTRSALGNTIAIGDEEGQVCITGNLEEVPNGDYANYWGVEVGFNLNQTSPDDGAAGAAGADGAAGAAGVDGAGGNGGDVAEPWMPGSVVGFSFVIEGPTIDLIRFKALPSGYDPALESSVFCKTVMATSGEPNDVPFAQMIQYCWNATGTPLPLAAGLANISWQLPADVGVTRPFDWCVKDLRPLLAP
jgi:hypothetical protein